MIAGYVLAGGLSSRMGTDKARLPDPDGWPFAAKVADLLGEVVDEVAILRRTDDGLPWKRPSGRPLSVVYEPPAPGRHPLWGVAAGLARGHDALFVPCDLPNLPVEALLQLRAAGPPAVACAEDGVHPLVCYLPAAWATRATALAESGESARSLVLYARRVHLPGAWLDDVNEPLGRTRWQTLTENLRFLAPGARERALEGERARLAARGAVPAPVSAGARPPPG